MPSKETTECSRPSDLKWHVVLLERTFRDKTLQETAACLADVLDISLAEGLQKATSATDGTTFVVSTCEDCLEADAQAQLLRSKGLRVQVASDLGLPDSPKTPKVTIKSSYQSIFRDAEHDRDPLQRRPHRLGSLKSVCESIPRDADHDGDTPPRRVRRLRSLSPDASLEVAETATARRNKFLSLPSFAPDRQGSPQQLDREDHSDKVVSLARLQASALVHFLIFGNRCSPSKKLTRKDEDVSVADIQVLCQFWITLDEDASNDIDHVEFKHYVDLALLNRYRNIEQEMETLPQWAQMNMPEKINLDFPKFIRRMREKVSDHLFRGRSSFMLHDLLELSWPHASATRLESLAATLEKALAAIRGGARASSPPVLDKVAYQDLCAVFRDIDDDRRGVLSFSGLGSLGLIDNDSMVETVRAWDVAGNGFLDMATFCEMMCPSGFRATEASRVATSQDGRKMILAEPMTWSWEQVRS